MKNRRGKKPLKNETIHLLTFHFSVNYGATLQLYALYTFLRKQGYRVKVTDYRSEGMKNRLYWTRLLKRTPKYLLTGWLMGLRKYKFKQFNDTHFVFTDRCHTLAQVAALPTPSAYVCGSDQIWNPTITDGLDDVYFANFDTKAKKIAYAASVGQDEIHQKLEKKLIHRANKMDAVGIREESLREKLVLNKETTLVLDPTFLVPKSTYKNIAVLPNFEDYVLIYAMSNNETCVKLAKELAQKKGLKTILVKGVKKNGVDKVLFAPSIEEFLGLVQKASYVVTSSFHGLAFSLIFGKEFFCVPSSEGKSSRLIDLLKLVELEDRLVEQLPDKQFSKIDYTHVKKMLKPIQEQSKQFLLKALSGDSE